MECAFCKETKLRNRDIFKCDGCDNQICLECSKITASEVKVLQLVKGRQLLFRCQQCSTGDTYKLYRELIDAKNIIIDDKTDIINMLRREIEQLKKEKIDTNFGSENASYSQITKKHKEEVIIIKPINENQTSHATKQTVEEKINPSILGVGVSRVKYVKGGGVAIRCRETSKETNIQSVCENVKNQLGGSYEVRIPNKQNPRIKVFNLNKKQLEDEDLLIESIVIQNVISTDLQQREMKILHKYETKEGRSNIILELDPITYSQVKRKSTLHIGWKTCYFCDYINIIQCYKCYKFGHLAKNCRSEKDICPKCAGDHKKADCRSMDEICVNCKYAAEVQKIPNIDYKHTAYNRTCKLYQKIYSELQDKINYTELYQQNIKK